MFWPGEFHGICSPWGCKESDTTEWLSLHFMFSLGFPGCAGGKEPMCQFRRHKRYRFNPRLERYTGGGHGNPLQYSCLENPMDRGAWWATFHGVKKSRTQLKWLSMDVHMFSLLSLSLRWFDTGRGSHCNRPSRCNRRPTGPSLLQGMKKLKMGLSYCRCGEASFTCSRKPKWEEFAMVLDF